MDNISEVVGWVLVDDAARVLVRKASREPQAAPTAEQAFEHVAIQTGSFHRNRIIDSVTRLALVSEMD